PALCAANTGRKRPQAQHRAASRGRRIARAGASGRRGHQARSLGRRAGLYRRSYHHRTRAGQSASALEDVVRRASGARHSAGRAVHDSEPLTTAQWSGRGGAAMNEQKPLRVFLVDDEALALRRLARLLRETGRVEIAGQESDLESALARLEAADVRDKL